MKKLKIIFTTILLNLLFSSAICYNVNALMNIDYGNYSYNNYENCCDKEDNLKRENIETKSSEIHKGFIFKTYFKIPKDAPTNFVDIINKSLKNMAINNIPDEYTKGSNVGLLFKIFDLKMNGNKCNSNSYVLAKSKKELNRMVKLYRKGISGNIYDKYYFNKLPMSKDEYEEYINKYSKRLFKKLRNFVMLLKNLYEEEKKERLKKILNMHYKDMAHSENVLSYMNQSKVMKKLIKVMLDCLEYDNKKIKNKKKKNIIDYDDDLLLKEKEEYDDLDELDDDDSDDEIEEYFNFSDKKLYDRNSFKKFLRNYYRAGVNNIKKLKKISYDEYRDSMTSVIFKKELKPVTRKIEKISGYIETIEKK